MPYIELLTDYWGVLVGAAVLIAGFLFNSKRKRTALAEEAAANRKATYVVKLTKAEAKEAATVASATLVEASEKSDAAAELSVTLAEVKETNHAVDVAEAKGGDALADEFNDFLGSDPGTTK